MDAKISFQIVKQIGNLTANFDELKKSVTNAVARYKGLVYTDDQITEAKSDLAYLRAERKRIDDARKDVKKEFMKPYDSFESQVKETLAIYDDAISEISKQVKDAEEAEKARKKVAIEEWWLENGVKSVKGIKLAQVWDERYLNKTYTEKKWQEDLSKKRDAIEQDLSTISFFEPEMMNFVLPMYMRTLNLSDATTEYERFKENQRRTEEARIRAEEARKAREEQDRLLKEQRQMEADRRRIEENIRKAEEEARQTTVQPVSEAIQTETTIPSQETKEPVKTEKRYSMTFSIEGNASATKELCDTLRKLKSEGGLKFTVIETREWEE